MKSDRSKIQSRSPHFICIGAQKAATTWLHSVLQLNPAIWVPPVKELQHFNSLLENRPTIYRQRRRVHQLQSACRKALKGTKGETPDMQTLKWMAQYCLEDCCDDEWYEELFRPGAGKICGEITPSYATLAKTQVHAIRDRWPDLKVIFIMREPIERALSGMKERLGNKKKRIKKLNDAQMIEILDSEQNATRTDYRYTIETWETHFPRQQIKYLFYDQLQSNPDAFLGGVLDFLGVEDAAVRLSKLTGRANPSPEVNIGLPVRKHLAHKYRDLTRWLRDRFGGDTEQWVANLDRALNA